LGDVSGVQAAVAEAFQSAARDRERRSAEVRTLARPENPFTPMAVRAHPDDEASTTGGILAKYAAESATTVVVTCTNGELGDGPGGVKPGEHGHEEAGMVTQRRRELEESCRILGVSHLEPLDYAGAPSRTGRCP
jgi:LmbE family N-acetylglucosaminyl deacetylase